jgi:hypothetical protein
MKLISFKANIECDVTWSFMDDLRIVSQLMLCLLFLRKKIVGGFLCLLMVTCRFNPQNTYKALNQDSSVNWLVLKMVYV